MKDQLRILLQLQAIDAKVKELDAQIKSLPSRLEPARRDLAKLEAMLAEEKKRLAETDSWKKQQETLLEREQDAYKSAKAKLGASRTGKEFNAATREIDAKKKSMLEREGEIKKVSAVVTETTGQVTAHEADVDTIRQSLAGEERDVAERIATLREEITRVSEGRDGLRASIDKNLLKTYDALTTKRGYSVAPVEKGVCLGCHTTLPPQLNNMLARGETIESCPRCLRIVYRPETLEPPAAAEAPAADAPAPAAE